MTDKDILIEVLKEVRQLREEVSEVLILFKPRPSNKRLTKRQRFDLEVKRMRVEETARLISKY